MCFSYHWSEAIFKHFNQYLVMWQAKQILLPFSYKKSLKICLYQNNKNGRYVVNNHNNPNNNK